MHGGLPAGRSAVVVREREFSERRRGVPDSRDGVGASWGGVARGSLRDQARLDAPVGLVKQVARVCAWIEVVRGEVIGDELLDASGTTSLNPRRAASGETDCRMRDRLLGIAAAR